MEPEGLVRHCQANLERLRRRRHLLSSNYQNQRVRRVPLSASTAKRQLRPSYRSSAYRADKEG